MTILFSLVAFKIMSLSLTFESFKIMCLEEDLSAFRELDGLLVSWTCTFSFFPRFRKVSALISLHKLSALSCLFSPSRIPIILTLPFLMKSDSCHRLSSFFNILILSLLLVSSLDFFLQTRKYSLPCGLSFQCILMFHLIY